MSRVGVGQRRNEERARMSGHVQAVSNQRYGAKPQPTDNFSDHHRAADGNNSPRFPLIPLVRLPQKNVRMSEIID
jgi:hypothetical protein